MKQNVSVLSLMFSSENYLWEPIQHHSNQLRVKYVPDTESSSHDQFRLLLGSPSSCSENMHMAAMC